MNMHILTKDVPCIQRGDVMNQVEGHYLKTKIVDSFFSPCSLYRFDVFFKL